MESLPWKRKGARSACSLARSLRDAARKRTCREPKPHPEKKAAAAGAGASSGGGGVVMTVPPASGAAAPESPGRGLKRKWGASSRRRRWGGRSGCRASTCWAARSSRASSGPSGSAAPRPGARSSRARRCPRTARRQSTASYGLALGALLFLISKHSANTLRRHEAGFSTSPIGMPTIFCCC